MSNIFSDMHHGGLYHSSHLLFEERLHHNLFRPVGLDWFEKGYWQIARPYKNSIDTVKQYLDLDQRYRPIDGTVQLNQIKQDTGTHYEIEDLNHGYIQKAVTWDQFLKMDIDVIIASIPAHYELYTKMRDIYKPKARVVCQVGNMFNEIEDMTQRGVVHNLLASTSDLQCSKYIHACYYHQEFPLSTFVYLEPQTSKIIRSYVHLFSRSLDYRFYQGLKELLSDYTLESYGALCENGTIDGLSNIAKSMQETGWVMHIKHGGDGYGHILWNAAFSGRPLITNKSYYKGQLGYDLMIDGETCIDINGKSVSQVASEIRQYSEPEEHKKLCNNMYERAKSLCDFEKDAIRVKGFLKDLI